MASERAFRITSRKSSPKVHLRFEPGIFHFVLLASRSPASSMPIMMRGVSGVTVHFDDRSSRPDPLERAAIPSFASHSMYMASCSEAANRSMGGFGISSFSHARSSGLKSFADLSLPDMSHTAASVHRVHSKMWQFSKFDFPKSV